MERISGPYFGYYIAAYTVRWETGHLAFAKICTRAPDDVWICQAIEKVGAGPMASAHQALVAAEEKARLYIRWRGVLEPKAPAATPTVAAPAAADTGWASLLLPWRKPRRCPT